MDILEWKSTGSLVGAPWQLDFSSPQGHSIEIDSLWNNIISDPSGGYPYSAFLLVHINRLLDDYYSPEEYILERFSIRSPTVGPWDFLEIIIYSPKILKCKNVNDFFVTDEFILI